MFSVALILLLAAGSCVNSIDLIQPDSMVVQPGQSLTITCQVSGYSVTDSSYATGWIRQCEGKPLDWISIIWSGGSISENNALKNKFSISRDTSAATVTLKGQNLQPEDTAVYYCARYQRSFDYWGKGTMVTVTTATSTKPTVFPLMQCGSGTGDMVTLGCLATGFTPSSLTYAWTKSGTALTDSIQYPPVQRDNVYTGVSQIRVRRQDWDDMQTFQCAVTHTAGNAQVVITKPTPPAVHYQLPTVKVLASSDEETEASFSCFAKDFSPNDYEIKWLKNEVEIATETNEVQTTSKGREVKNETLYSAASFLTLQSSEWTEGTKITCEFKGKGENGPTFRNSSVTHESTLPESCEGCAEADVEVNIIAPKMEDMFLNRKGTIICQVKINKPSVDRISWENEKGKSMADSSKSPAKGYKGVVSLALEISYDEWSQGEKRYCIVEHDNWFEPLKKPYERIIGGQTQRPSVFMLPPLEHTRQDMVTLTCYVKDFFPQEVFVSWLVDDMEADSDYQFHTTNPVKSQGSFSAYGQLSLSLDQWKNSDMVYSCVVYHESVVNTTKAIVRSIGHRSFEKTNLVNLNMNIPETCKAQ